MALCGAAGKSSAKATTAGEESDIVAWILPEVIYHLVQCRGGSTHHILQFGNHLSGRPGTRSSQFCYELIDRQTRVNCLGLENLSLQHSTNDLLYQTQITILLISHLFRVVQEVIDSPFRTPLSRLRLISRRSPSPSPRTLWRS